MLGLIARTAPEALLVALISAAFARIMAPIKNVILASPNATANTTFVRGLDAASSSTNFLLVGIVAFLLTILGRAMVEAQL